MFTGPTARDDAAGHAVAEVKTAAVFACGIKAFDGVPGNVENLRVVVDRKAACAVVEEHHETHGVEGPFADLRLEKVGGFIKFLVFAGIDKTVVARDLGGELGLLRHLREFFEGVGLKL